MKSERDKMLSGELYDPLDPQLCAERRRARLLCKALNATRDDEEDERARLIAELLPQAGHSVWIEPPFHCDYGNHITLGEKVFFNFNCVILDVAPVRIGSRVLCGPGVQIYAATHPLNAAERRTGPEYGKPIEMGGDRESANDRLPDHVPAIDRLVEIAQEAIGPAGGARMTGSGFGGCIVAVMPAARVDRVRTAIEARYCARASEPATIRVCRPSGGTGVLGVDVTTNREEECR